MGYMKVKGKNISVLSKKEVDFISLTDIAKSKNEKRSEQVIQNWMRNRHTIEFLGLWEKINNSKFKHLEFDVFRNESGLNSFVLVPKQWIKKTNAVGIISKSGRYGGTYAHKDIAFEFASWISTEFKLYLIKEFQRLKEEENERKSLDWDLRRNLARINYRIHTEAIKENIIPRRVSRAQEKKIYANEVDVLNVALYGMTASEWKGRNKSKIGNIRDYSSASQLVCLSNLESLNSEFIKEGLEQSKRLVKLNEIAMQQMRILTMANMPQLEVKNGKDND